MNPAPLIHVVQTNYKLNPRPVERIEALGCYPDGTIRYFRGLGGNLLHELCHWALASPTARKKPNLGLCPLPEGLDVTSYIEEHVRWLEFSIYDIISVRKSIEAATDMVNRGYAIVAPPERLRKNIPQRFERTVAAACTKVFDMPSTFTLHRVSMLQKQLTQGIFE